MDDGTVRRKAKERSLAERLEQEKSALRRVFAEPGCYEIRTSQGLTRRLFVVSSRPWRFAEVVSREVRRAAE
jgi:hypothetical protein